MRGNLTNSHITTVNLSMLSAAIPQRTDISGVEVAGNITDMQRKESVIAALGDGASPCLD